MKRGHIYKWPVHFLREAHYFSEIILVDNSEDDGYTQLSLYKCQDCSLVALQDKGSLGYYIIDNHNNYEELSCGELQIKSIIEF